MTREAYEAVDALSAARGQGIDPDFFEREMYTQFQTWLGETKSSEGCPVNCTYCFFKLDGQTPKRPDITVSPADTIAALAEAPTYHPDMPIHFGSQTDAFSTRKNIEHYTEILRLYGESAYANPVVFITKRRIPDSFMQLAASVPQDVIFYVSYSGLNDSGMEPTVNEQHQRDNLVRLKEHDLPRVHYWRPFLPQNSNPDQIESMLSFVSKYADCSVVNGLRLNDGIRDNIAPYWPEIMEQDFDFHNSGEFWPEGVRDFLARHAKAHYPDYPLFFGNTPCTIAYVTQKPDVQGLLGGRMCQESNCPAEQRDRCETARQVPSQSQITKTLARLGLETAHTIVEEDKLLLEQPVETGKLVNLRYALRIPVLSRTVDYAGGHNWANVTDDVRITEVPWTSSINGSSSH